MRSQQRDCAFVTNFAKKFPLDFYLWGFPGVWPRFVRKRQPADRFLEMGLREVGIDLGGLDILVAHEVTDDLEAHSGHGEPRAVSMAEIVEAAFQSGGPGSLLKMVGDRIRLPGEKTTHLGEFMEQSR